VDFRQVAFDHVSERVKGGGIVESVVLGRAHAGGGHDGGLGGGISVPSSIEEVAHAFHGVEIVILADLLDLGLVGEGLVEVEGTAAAADTVVVGGATGSQVVSEAS